MLLRWELRVNFQPLSIVPLRLTMTSVKRHAEAKNDTLGPQWTHWVSKAITRLVSKYLDLLYHWLHYCNISRKVKGYWSTRFQDLWHWLQKGRRRTYNPYFFPLQTCNGLLSQVSRMHVVLFKSVLRKRTKTEMILVSGNKSPARRVVESNGLAKVLPQIEVVWTPIQKTIQQAERINRLGNDPELLRSDLRLRSPRLS
jgi:hypothetical protein